jgi:energy-converting hydrogenase B subunit C
MMIVEYIQSALLLIAAFLVIVSAVGFISLSKDMKNVVYGRIHIIGIFDIACVIAMIGLGQYLLAGIYFILAPFTAHAIANAFYKSEDVENNVELNVVEEDEDNSNPFIVNKSKVQELEQKDSEKLKTDDRFTISTLEIIEEE